MRLSPVRESRSLVGSPAAWMQSSSKRGPQQSPFSLEGSTRSISARTLGLRTGSSNTGASSANTRSPFRPDPTTFRAEIGPAPDSRKPRSSSRPGTGAARCIPRTGPSNRTVTYLRCRQHFLAPERGTNQLIRENTGKLVATPTQLAGGTKPGEFGEPARFEVGPRGHLFVDCGPSGRSQRNSG